MYRGSGAGGHQVDLVDGNLTWLNAADLVKDWRRISRHAKPLLGCVRGRGACDDAQAAVCVPRPYPPLNNMGGTSLLPPIYFSDGGKTLVSKTKRATISSHPFSRCCQYSCSSQQPYYRINLSFYPIIFLSFYLF